VSDFADCALAVRESGGRPADSVVAIVVEWVGGVAGGGEEEGPEIAMVSLIYDYRSPASDTQAADPPAHRHA